MIILKNPGLLELDLITTMGASVKSEGAIGRFGSGAKYAIACFLRNNINFHLFIGENLYEFYTESKVVRDKSFNKCYMKGPMDSVYLGFVTDLGKDWQIWQAYREIYSNCLDEGGEIYYGKNSGVNPDSDSTTFVISTPIDTNGIFLREMNKELIYESSDIDIYKGTSNYIYYQGIRAKDLHKPSIYTYNIKRSCTLTEDRLLCYDHQVDAMITNAVAKMDNEETITTVVTAASNTYESKMTFGDWGADKPSETFKNTVNNIGTKINSSVNSYIASHTPQKERTVEQKREDFFLHLDTLCGEHDVEYTTVGKQVSLFGGILEEND